MIFERIANNFHENGIGEEFTLDYETIEVHPIEQNLPSQVRFGRQNNMW